MAKERQRKLEDYRIRVPQYTDRSKWIHSFITGDLRQSIEVACYYQLLVEMGFHKVTGSLATKPLSFNDRLTLLDVGCGCGYQSRIWAPLSREVYAFDLSDEGINVARSEWSHLSNITFFVADGIYPENAPELLDKQFDVIIMREFHPFTRFVTVDGQPVNHIELLRKYMSYLKPKGVCLVSHRLSSSEWKADELLKFTDILKRFPQTYGPVDLRLFLPFGIARLIKLCSIFRINPLRIYPLFSNVLWGLAKCPSKCIAIFKEG